MKKFNIKSIKTAFLASALAGGAIFGLVKYNQGHDVCFTVTDKERAVVGRGKDTSAEYRVTTEDPNSRIEVFRNTDSWLRLKFRSSDLQGLLKVNESYEARVYGFRIGLLSTYRNIVEAKPVESCPIPTP